MSGSEPQKFRKSSTRADHLSPTSFLLQDSFTESGSTGTCNEPLSGGLLLLLFPTQCGNGNLLARPIQLNRYSTQQEVNRRCDLPLVRCRSGLLNGDGETVGISRTWILALQSNGLRAGKIGCWNCHLQVRIVDEGGGSGRSIPERNRSRQETRS